MLGKPAKVSMCSLNDGNDLKEGRTTIPRQAGLSPCLRGGTCSELCQTGEPLGVKAELGMMNTRLRKDP